MIWRRIAVIVLVLPILGKVEAGQVNVEVTLTSMSTSGLRSSGYVSYTSFFGNSTSEWVVFSHFIENYDAYRSSSGSTPISSVISSGTAPSPPNCYRGIMDANADDSQARAVSQAICYEGPPPPEDGELIQSCSEPTGCGSPIILDLGGQGYKLTSLAEGVQFDLRNEGLQRQIAWTSAGLENAFLAMDRNGNGQIDSGAELFGNFTPLRSGELAAHGFEALSELDDNHDGVMDVADDGWSDLLLWVDRNHDGRSAAGEIVLITDSMVSSLKTDHKLIQRRDQWGNLFRYVSYFEFEKGGNKHQRQYFDVFFRMEN